MNPQSEESSDQFSGRLGLIFATIDYRRIRPW